MLGHRQSGPGQDTGEKMRYKTGVAALQEMAVSKSGAAPGEGALMVQV